MRIPKIIHQLWKTAEVPLRWRTAVGAVKRFHPGWEYRLWTDAEMFAHIEARHPGFAPIFEGFNRHIMRVDAFRYILMHDFGGLYCDLDYEFLRPFDYGDAEVVLSFEDQTAFGDEVDHIANYLFASVPGHALWVDILGELERDPPRSVTSGDVCVLTGPGLITRIALGNAERYTGVRFTDKPVFSPRRVHGRYERKFYINSGNTYGFHHGWGSWKERLNLPYLRNKFGKYGRRLLHPDL